MAKPLAGAGVKRYANNLLMIFGGDCFVINGAFSKVVIPVCAGMTANRVYGILPETQLRKICGERIK